MPKTVQAILAFILAIIAFLIALRNDMYLGILALITISFISIVVFCLYVIFSKKPSEDLPFFKKGPSPYQPKYNNHFRLYAGAGLITVSIIIFALIIMLPTRSFVMIAFTGTLTPSPTPTITSTPTSTATPTFTPTATPTPIPANTYTPTATATSLFQSSSIELGTLIIHPQIVENESIAYTAELSIDSIGYGDLKLEVPARVLSNESAIVRLQINPDSTLENLPKVAIASLSPEASIFNSGNSLYSEGGSNYVLKFDDRIQVYPVMSAELNGINTEIAPSGNRTLAVISSSPIEWVWTVSAKQLGMQSLILTISIPVIVDSNNEQIVSHILKSIPIQILFQEKSEYLEILEMTREAGIQPVPLGVYSDPYMVSFELFLFIAAVIAGLIVRIIIKKFFK